MSRRANWIGLGAFVLGVAGFQTYAARLRAEVAGGAPQEVLVLTRDLSAGDKLEEEALLAVRIPEDYLDTRRVRAEDSSKVLGAALGVALTAGDGLVWSDIADGAARRHLALLVEPGKRAYSLDGSANPLGELLRVGDQVDVLVERNQKSTTLIERVSVLAVGADLGADNEDLDEVSSRGGGVTLSVTPTEAESLQAAETGGDLRLVVRNPSDLRVSEQSVSTTEESRSSWKHEESRAQKTREIEHVR